MIESVSQIGSKITACSHFMQPTKTRRVPNMLAAGANKKKAPVRIFFVKNDLCNSSGLFIPSAFLLFYYLNCLLRKG